MNARRAEKYLAESFTAQVKRMRDAAGTDDAHAIAQLAEFESAELRVRVSELVEKLFERCERKADGETPCSSISRPCSTCATALRAGHWFPGDERHDVSGAGGVVIEALVACGVALLQFRRIGPDAPELAIALKQLADLGIVPR